MPPTHRGPGPPRGPEAPPRGGRKEGKRRGRAEGGGGAPAAEASSLSPALLRPEGSGAGFSGILRGDGVAAAAHRAALVAGGAGAGLQPGAHDAAGHQHLPGGHRAQVPAPLGERGRAGQG